MPAEAAAGRTTNMVRGRMRVSEALRRLLRGSGIRVAQDDGATIVLSAEPPARRRPREAVAVPSRIRSPEPLQEIVVTADRRLEDGQQVPIAISAFDAAEVRQAGVERTSDLPLLVPGLLYTQGVGLGIPYIRGVGSTANGAGAENEVALYVDDVYQGSKTSAIQSFPDLDQIEVLKGPQGTLFGRNATGGLVQIKTLEPKQEAGGFLRIGYSSYDTLDASLYLTGPLGADTTASVAAFAHDQHDGWGVNLPTGTPVNRANETGVRFKLASNLGSRTKIRVEADLSSLRSSIGSAYRPLYGVLPAQGPPFTGGKYDTSDSLDPITLSKAAGASVRVDRAAGWITLSSISADRRTSWRFLLDEDWLPVDYLTAVGTIRETALSQEFRLSGSPNGRLQIQGGIYGYFARGRETISFSGDSLAPLDRRDTVGDQTTRSAAVYAQAMQPLGDATDVTLGVRYTLETRHLTGYRVEEASGASAISDKVDRSTTAQAPTWRIALDHRLAPDIRAYVSYDRGFKSGGFSTGNPSGPVLKPESIDAVQAGIKSEWWDHRLRLNLAAFHYAWRNIQLQTNRNAVSIITNAAAARSDGVDLDFDAQVTRRLRFSFGAEWLRGLFTHYPNALGVAPLPTGGNTATTINAAGNRLPFSPATTASAAALYDVATRGGDLEISAVARYNAHYYTEPNNILVQPAYAIVNARACWQPRDRRYSLTAWADNLTNHFYAVALTVQPAASVLSPAAPRTIGATLEVHY